MAFRVDDPFFDQPVIDYLHPVTQYTEIPDDQAEIDLALIVVNYQPGPGGRVVRAEVTRAPRYIVAEHGRMVNPEDAVQMAANGHKVTIERFVVQGGYLDLMDPDLASEIREDEREEAAQ